MHAETSVNLSVSHNDILLSYLCLLKYQFKNLYAILFGSSCILKSVRKGNARNSLLHRTKNIVVTYCEI